MEDYVKKRRQGTIGKCKKHNCLKMGEKLLETLGDKWNPVKCTPYKDNLDHTPKRKEANESIRSGPTLYNPDVTEKGDENLKPVHRKHTYPQKQWTLYTDGACLEGNTSIAKAGAGTFCLEDETKNHALRVPGPSQTNQRGELLAIVKALSLVPKGDELTIITDSWYAVQGIIENLRKWEDEGWMKVQNADIFQKIAYELDTRGGETYFQWVKGHSNNPGNDGADKKSSEGAHKENADDIKLEVPKEYKLQGARLAAMTQKLA